MLETTADTVTVTEEKALETEEKAPEIEEQVPETESVPEPAADPEKDPLEFLEEEKKNEEIKESAKEIDTLDILVCGKCHDVYHNVEAFQDHKTGDKCTESDDLKETLKEEKKPQIWAFTLWKNTKFKQIKEDEEEKQQSSWSIYQLWRDLEPQIKNSWLKAGENVQALYEIACKFETVKASKKMDEEEKDPLSLDGESSATTKPVLKPVIINQKVASLLRKQSNTRRAIRAGDTKEQLVEKIVSKRFVPRRRTYEYLIKWENFDAEKNTWEPVAKLQNCKTMIEEFEKNLQIQKEQIKLEKILAKKMPKKPEVIQYSNEGRPQRTSKQKAMNQVKQWCGSIEADENTGKRAFSDDSEDDDSFEKRLKYEDYSSDSENDAPVVTIKRIPKTPNGVDKAKKIDPLDLPDNILIPDSKGIVRINQKQIPSLSTGVYVMSKTAGIIKLDTKASKLATSGGQTVLKVAPKIGQTSIKVIKKDLSNGTLTTTRTANILRSKPPLKNYSGKVYMQRKTNAQIAAKKALDVAKEEEKEKEDDESDGVEELEFPTNIPIPAPDSPEPDFTLCPLTGKVVGKDGKAVEPEPEEKVDEVCANDNTAALDNLVNMAAADILKDLAPASIKTQIDTDTEIKSNEDSLDTPMDVDISESIKKEMIVKSEITTVPETPTIITAPIILNQQLSTSETKPSPALDSILSTALTNANIPLRRPSGGPPPLMQRSIQSKSILNRTPGSKPGPQAVITRITPGTSPIQRSRVIAPRKESPIIRKRTIGGPSMLAQNRNVVRRVSETKVYTPTASGQLQQVVTSYVATPTTTNTVINMPSLLDTHTLDTSEDKLKADNEESLKKEAQVQIEESLNVATTSSQGSISLNNLALNSDSETPLLITGEDGTIYQVAGQNEDGQTILITQGEDGEQQCLLVAPENAGLINQAIMKAEETPVVEEATTTSVPTNEPVTVNTTEAEESTDESQVVAQIVSANPPSPGGTRKVVLMLPDGNFMMTEVTAEQYAALELDK